MGISLAYKSLELIQETCIICGCVFAIPDGLRNQLLKNHNNFYCPNGHSQHFTGESEADKLKRELELQKRRTEWAEAESKKTLKKLKKVEKRIANGVCPCCNRTFVNLQRHMKTKHKEYVKE